MVSNNRTSKTKPKHSEAKAAELIMYKPEIPLRGSSARWKHILNACVALFVAALNCEAAIPWYEPHPNLTIARNWSERILESIRMDTPHPPAQARNLFSYSVCMYDAWAAYDTNAVGFIYRGKHTAPDIAAARREAISYAMHRMMIERLAYSRTATNQAEGNILFMARLGYDTNNVSRDTNTPAGIGNSIYDAVSAWFINDGSRQTAGTPFPTANPPVAYPDYPVGNPRRYAFFNERMNPFAPGTTFDGTNTLFNVNIWQRLNVPGAIDQNGFTAPPLQGYAGAPWLWVRAFALGRIDDNKPWIDPGPPPHLGTNTAWFLSNLVEVIRYSSQLTTGDGVITNISPATIGNNTLGNKRWSRLHDQPSDRFALRSE